MGYRTGAQLTWKEAKEQLKADKHVSRSCWNDGMGSLYLESKGLDDKGNLKGIKCMRDFRPDSPAWIWHCYMVNMYWSPSREEELATDWQIYNVN